MLTQAVPSKKHLPTGLVLVPSPRNLNGTLAKGPKEAGPLNRQRLDENVVFYRSSIQ